jgi:hypothetical protein
MSDTMDVWAEKEDARIRERVKFAEGIVTERQLASEDRADARQKFAAEKNEAAIRINAEAIEKNTAALVRIATALEKLADRR